MAASVHQRGETAVLGLGARSSPLAPLALHDAPSLSSGRLHDKISSIQESKIAARGVARRKLRRRENGESF
jgi:hypothetical protein